MKRVIACLLCIAGLVSSIFFFGGCNSKPLLIVYLGDSIAEALAGPSPLSEREKYGYYGVIGICNNYIYRNRAISGSRSIDMLEYIKQEDEDAKVTRSLLKEADIIHISILGNDLLLSNLGDIMRAALEGDYTEADNIIAQSRVAVAEIIAVLRSYNKHAAIIFQNVYNPIKPGSLMLDKEMDEAIAERNMSPEEFKGYGEIVLDRLNGILVDYADEHPGEIHIIDTKTKFNEITEQNSERGERLIGSDGIHPSSYGHAVVSDLAQTLLEELGLANKKQALKKYKELRLEQLVRMYADTTVDVAATKKAIKSANNCEDVTNIYFDAIADVIPNYFN